jgi:signal transduction histidine kinase
LISEEQNQIRLAVQDEGEGIPKEAVPLIFERSLGLIKHAHARMEVWV